MVHEWFIPLIEATLYMCVCVFINFIKNSIMRQTCKVNKQKQKIMYKINWLMIFLDIEIENFN